MFLTATAQKKQLTNYFVACVAHPSEGYVWRNTAVDCHQPEWIPVIALH